MRDYVFLEACTKQKTEKVSTKWDLALAYAIVKYNKFLFKKSIEVSRIV